MDRWPPKRSNPPRTKCPIQVTGSGSFSRNSGLLRLGEGRENTPPTGISRTSWERRDWIHAAGRGGESTRLLLLHAFLFFSSEFTPKSDDALGSFRPDQLWDAWYAAQINLLITGEIQYRKKTSEKRFLAAFRSCSFAFNIQWNMDLQIHVKSRIKIQIIRRLIFSYLPPNSKLAAFPSNEMEGNVSEAYSFRSFRYGEGRRITSTSHTILLIISRKQATTDIRDAQRRMERTLSSHHYYRGLRRI